MFKRLINWFAAQYAELCADADATYANLLAADAKFAKGVL